MKKRTVIISAVVLVGLGGLGFLYLRRAPASKNDAATVTRRTVRQSVNVTGRVVPTSDVQLAFERSGRVVALSVGVGSRVTDGQVLVELDHAELSAQLQQAQASVAAASASLGQNQASLDSQRAKLQELQRGTRPEELALAQTQVTNAQKQLNDARVAEDQVKLKATSDLSNLYASVEDIVSDALSKAEEAVNKDTDELFTDDTSFNPKLTFSTSDGQSKTDAESGRQRAGAAAAEIRTVLNSVTNSPVGSNQDAALSQTGQRLAEIRTFLRRLGDAVNTSIGLSQATLNTYKAAVVSATSSINTSLTAVNNQQQKISTQLNTNSQALTAAQSKINDAKNAVAVAEDQLSIKQAGSSREQLQAQEAQVRQAELQVKSQAAQVASAHANVANVVAQIAKTVLRAPFTGIITTQDAKRGQIVAANTPVVRLISDNTFQVEANVPEADEAKIRPNQKAAITVDAYGSDVEFPAVVLSIDPGEKIIEGVPTYKVTLKFLKNDDRLKSGMTANIDMVTAERANVLAIPQRAVFTKSGEKYVRVIASVDPKSSTTEERKVDLGLVGSDGYAEITNGLQEGQAVKVGE